MRRAFRRLPREWRERLANVAVVIEDDPPPGEDYLGLFEGTSPLEPGPALLPHKITLYRKPLEASCATRPELEREISRTLRHEIGHYFGLEETQLEALENSETGRRKV